MLRSTQLIGFGPAEETGIRLVGYKTEGFRGAPGTLDISSGLTGGLSSGAASGDFVIGVLAYSSSAFTNRALTITDGGANYTLLGTELFADDDDATNLRAGYKFITADTSISFTVDGGTQDAGIKCAYVFKGVNTVTPIDTTVQTAIASNTLLVNPPAITPVTAKSQIVVIGAGSVQTGVFNPYDAPGDLVDVLSVFLGGNPSPGRGCLLAMGRKTDWVSGSFDPAAWTQTGGSNTSRSCASITLALRPAS